MVRQSNEYTTKEIIEKIDKIHEIITRIEVQTTKTNGRVTAVEKDNIGMSGRLISVENENKALSIKMASVGAIVGILVSIATMLIGNFI